MQVISNAFLSTPSARRATSQPTNRSTNRPISIHALREEGDRRPRGRVGRALPFLSTPSARRATGVIQRQLLGNIFLSTPSARRATAAVAIHGRRPADFYPRPPRGGRPAPEHRRRTERGISIHALREEGDGNRLSITSGSSSFLSTPSARRATGNSQSQGGSISISIHALREEGDHRKTKRANTEKKISIHALREEGDHYQSEHTLRFGTFLSTPSARRATA